MAENHQYSLLNKEVITELNLNLPSHNQLGTLHSVPTLQPARLQQDGLLLSRLAGSRTPSPPWKTVMLSTPVLLQC